LRNELNKVMRNAAKPLIPKVREAARASLPKGGGLNERIAKKPLRAQTRTGNATAGVRIVGTKVDPRINDQGRVFHPVFGTSRASCRRAEQAKGYFDDTLAAEGPGITADLVSALNTSATASPGRSSAEPVAHLRRPRQGQRLGHVQERRRLGGAGR
jgi:hypothetical protein